jgi:hypothetical protein
MAAWPGSPFALPAQPKEQRPGMPLLAVFGVAVVEIWFAVPTGLAMGLPAPTVWILTVTGAIASVTVVASAGDALRSRLLRRRSKDSTPRTGRIYDIWVRYGVPGWGLASPLFMAPPMGTAVALMLGAPKRRLMIWMFGGVLVWTSILVIAGIVGLSLIRAIH